jgi:dTDP-4-dehydrorhamnose 3,5-epimerase
VKVRESALAGVLVVEPELFEDARGCFLEGYRRSRYAAAGMRAEFVQDNLSLSRRGVLRGLHLQHPRAQTKLVQVLEGEVFDVALDARVGSPGFGRWVGVLLSGDNRHQLYIPEGFAHGFCVLSERALFAYKCSAEYSPADEITIRWDDPALGIAWPLREVELSPRDAAAPALLALRDRLPRL